MVKLRLIHRLDTVQKGHAITQLLRNATYRSMALAGMQPDSVAMNRGVIHKSVLAGFPLPSSMDHDLQNVTGKGH
jgi:hypothetical protein